MTRERLIATCTEYAESAPENVIGSEIAITPELSGVKIYDRPLFGFGDAHDPMFENLRKPEAVGDCLLLPGEWLEGAKSVISFFLPFTGEVRKSNKENYSEPSSLWLHGRVEGQKFINLFCSFVAETLRAEGHEAVIPSMDSRFKTFRRYNGLEFTSRWSERHAAYICGLGTFGLSKGLITEKGIAGRFGSVITTAAFDVTKRRYKEVYEYCTMCGACIKNCPADAITMEEGKNQTICAAFVDATAEKYKPRYGCGKCQVGVPCQNGIPKKE